MSPDRWGRSRMVRLWWFAAIAVALALPAQTAAGPGTAPVPFEGKFVNGGTVKFGLQEVAPSSYEIADWDPSDKNTAIWQWNNLRIKCRGSGKHKYDGFFKPEGIPVINYHFDEERVNRWGGTAKVYGDFTTDYQHANGFFKIRGRTAWGRHCRSGKVEWSATPVAPPPV